MTKSTQSLRDRIYARDRGRCFYCNQQVPYEAATLDHRTPRSQGGKSNDRNLVLCCLLCNRAKADRTEHEWFAMPRAMRRELIETERRRLQWS